MSTFESDDLETTGYFLPEDSQLRLKQLGEYATFLSNLARPRRPDEDMEGYAEIRPGDVAICLELLAEQVEAVLGELSYPAERGAKVPAFDAGAAVEAEPDVSVSEMAADTGDAAPVSNWPPTNEAGERYVAENRGQCALSEGSERLESPTGNGFTYRRRYPNSPR